MNTLRKIAAAPLAALTMIFYGAMLLTAWCALQVEGDQV